MGIGKKGVDKTYVDSLVAAVSASPKGVYATVADLQTAFSSGNSNIYLVTADGKWYFWNGTAWAAGGVYQSTGLADGIVTNSKLASTVASLIPSTFTPPFDDNAAYIYVITDTNDRVALGIKKDGSVIGKFVLPDGSVTAGKLSTALQGALPSTIDSASGFVYAIVDNSNHIAFGIRTNGKAYFGGGLDPLSIPSKSIDETKLSDSVNTKLTKYGNLTDNQYDMLQVDPDDWRSTQGTLAIATENYGYSWTKLPSMLTPIVKGINTSGVDLIFRKRMGLNIRGRHYRGTFDPKANGVESKTYKGTFQSTSTFPPTSGTFAVGDYYIYTTNNITTTVNGYGYNYGDKACFDGTNWIKQTAPSTATVAAEGGDWYLISNAGYFDGVSYAVNDRLYFAGTQAAAENRYTKFIKGGTANGEYYLRGEFDPTGGLPTLPLDGDVWIASAVGSAGGFTFAVNDMLVRESGVWGYIPTNPITTVLNGAYAHLPCIRNSNEWEVRRLDKANAKAYAKFSVYKQTGRKVQVSDLVFWGDSMPGKFNLTGAMQPFIDAGRTYAINSFGGGTSTHVLEMMQYEILNSGDRYRNRVHIFWHGQNNNNDAFYPTVPRMIELIGAHQNPRFVLFSVLGERLAYSFNGSRLVITTQEDLFNQVPGSRYDIINYYKRTYPDNWFDSRAQLITTASSSIPCLDFPGMTEKQVADTYGILPLSYFFDYTTVSWKPSDLTFVGWHSAAGLPTGGSDLNYYVRTGGGTRLGNIIVKENGTWIEYAHDVTHLNVTGATALAKLLKSFLDTRGW